MNKLKIITCYRIMPGLRQSSAIWTLKAKVKTSLRLLETSLMILGANHSCMSDELLSPTSVSVLALAQDNPDPAERDSVLNCDLDCVDGKCYNLVYK